MFFNNGADDREAEAGAAKLARVRFVDGVEPIEDVVEVFVRDTEPFVGDGDDGHLGRFVFGEGDGDLGRCIGVLSSIIKQICEGVLEKLGVGNDGGVALWGEDVDLRVREDGEGHLLAVLEKVGDGDRFEVAAWKVFDIGQAKKVADEGVHPDAAADNLSRDLGAGLDGEVGIIFDRFGETADNGDGSF